MKRAASAPAAAHAAAAAAPDAACPCGATDPTEPRSRGPARPLPYALCCGRWHRADAWGQADSAEALMRSRYSAYVLGRLDYIRDTWHASTRPDDLAPDPAGLRWLGLTVLAHTRTGPDRAEVHFVARHKLGGRAHRLEERSRFVRAADGRWYYLDAVLPDAQAPKA